MQIKEIMQKQIISVKQGTTLAQLLALFKKFHSFPIVPVTDNEQKLIGFVHIRSFFEIFQPSYQGVLMHNPLSMVNREPTDIFDIEIDGGLGLLVIVADIMDKKIVKVEETQDLKDAYELLQLHNRDAIPVVDKENKLVGVVSVFDIVMEIFKEKGIV